MRRTLTPAEMCEVDYAGMTMPVATADGERQVSIFVGTLPFSTIIYAEATWTQTTEDWLGSHVRMFNAWGGSVPKLVPDNLKTGVTHASYYDPVLNPSYLALARHYEIGVVPARVRHPRDKPLAENGVQQVERWVLAPLRNRTFFSLDELNAAMAEKLAELNNRPLSADSTQTRASLFAEHEKPKLKTLPSEPFEIGRWQRFKLGSDYHVRIDGVAYSAPFGLIGKPVDVYCTVSLIGIFHQGERVASHPLRRPEPGVLRPAVTLDEHRPPQHRAAARLTPEAIREKAAAIGGALTVLSDKIFLARRSSRTGRAPSGRTSRARREVRRRCAADGGNRRSVRQRAFLRLRPPMAGQRPDGSQQRTRQLRRRPPRECAWPRLLPLTRKPT